MNTFAKTLISFVAGSFLGWMLLVGFCSIPGLKFSVACGHNAYIWVPIFIPLGIFVCWYSLGLISNKSAKDPTLEKD